MSRALAPTGGNDDVQTPVELARLIVEHFRPSGRILDPARGGGAFFHILQSFCNGEVEWCEIKEGKDFLKLPSTEHYDWIVTNLPWSQFREFLCQAMDLSDNIVFLSLVNTWFMRARVEDMRKAGFGLVEILYLPTPPKPWPPTGFALGAGWARRGWTGSTHHNYKYL